MAVSAEGSTARLLLSVVHPIGLERFLAMAPTVSLPTGKKTITRVYGYFWVRRRSRLLLASPFAAAGRRALWGIRFRRRAYVASHEWVHRLVFANADDHPLGPGMGPDNRWRGAFLHDAARYPCCRLSGLVRLPRRWGQGDGMGPLVSQRQQSAGPELAGDRPVARHLRTRRGRALPDRLPPALRRAGLSVLRPEPENRRAPFRLDEGVRHRRRRDTAVPDEHRPCGPQAGFRHCADQCAGRRRGEPPRLLRHVRRFGHARRGGAAGHRAGLAASRR